MPSFPALKTGAVAQYPTERTLQFSTHQTTFLDGSEQRFRQQSAPLRRWLINLADLDEAEILRVEEFVALLAGRKDVFSFIDPWDGTTYHNCSLESDQVNFQWSKIASAETTLLIRQNEN